MTQKWLNFSSQLPNYKREEEETESSEDDSVARLIVVIACQGQRAQPTHITEGIR
jgi:hypothetical protein